MARKTIAQQQAEAAGQGTRRPRPNNSVTGAKVLLAKENRRKALALRQAGFTYREVADQCGYASSGSAREAVKSLVEKLDSEPAEELKRMEYERLNYMLSRAWLGVTAGRDSSIRTALAIMDKIDQLMGVNAISGPTATISVEHSGNVGVGVLVIDGDEDIYKKALQRMAVRSNPNLSLDNAGNEIIDIETGEWKGPIPANEVPTWLPEALEKAPEQASLFDPDTTGTAEEEAGEIEHSDTSKSWVIHPEPDDEEDEDDE